MKLEVGQFIRTNYGKIDKILKLNGSYVKGVSQKDEFYAYDLDNIVKASYNIIDILEVDDYVNGELITKLKKDKECKYLVTMNNNVIRNKDIDTLITHEQIAQISYRIEE